MQRLVSLCCRYRSAQRRTVLWFSPQCAASDRAPMGAHQQCLATSVLKSSSSTIFQRLDSCRPSIGGSSVSGLLSYRLVSATSHKAYILFCIAKIWFRIVYFVFTALRYKINICFAYRTFFFRCNVSCYNFVCLSFLIFEYKLKTWLPIPLPIFSEDIRSAKVFFIFELSRFWLLCHQDMATLMG